MGRLQKKKTDKHKIKLKDKETRDSSENGVKGKADVSRQEAMKRPAPQTKIFGAKKAANSAKEPGRIDQLQDFLREVKGELKKVVWPTKNQTVASTVVVIVLVIIVSSFLGLFDLGLKSLIRMVLN